MGTVRICVRPPSLLEACSVRQREAEKVFDFGKRQDDAVRVSIGQGIYTDRYSDVAANGCEPGVVIVVHCSQSRRLRLPQGSWSLKP
jgi:hypothetical protein